MTATTAITLFYKQVIRTKSIPFDISAYEIPNKETLEALREIKEMERHPERYKTFHTVEELMEDLLK